MKKLYYSISEVCQIIDEEQHILRYWEKEFAGLRPKKNRGGNRIYSDKDLDIVKVIKILIREEMLSLKGAKEQLKRILEKNLVLDYIKSDEVKPKNESPRISTRRTGNKNSKIENDLIEDLKQTLRDTLDYLKSI